MKFFKNKFFIIALAVAVFLTVFTTTLSVMGRMDPFKEVLFTLSAPFRYLGEKVGEGFRGFERYFTTIGQLQEENESLREQIGVLEKENADANAILEENQRLYEYLEVKRTYPDLTFCQALVIGRSTENYASVYTLNKGSQDGVKLGMPVIIKEGLVGSVCELGKNHCKVRVLSEASASAGAYVVSTGETGLIEGDISLKGTNTCFLSYLPNESLVAVGDLVYTSGEGSIYPRDLYIGKVIAVETDPYLRTVRATVEISADLSDLTYLMIVTDFEINQSPAETH